MGLSSSSARSGSPKRGQPRPHSLGCRLQSGFKFTGLRLRPLRLRLFGKSRTLLDWNHEVIRWMFSCTCWCCLRLFRESPNCKKTLPVVPVLPCSSPCPCYETCVDHAWLALEIELVVMLGFPALPCHFSVGQTRAPAHCQPHLLRRAVQARTSRSGSRPLSLGRRTQLGWNLIALENRSIFFPFFSLNERRSCLSIFLKCG